MLSETQLQQFHNDGYTVVENLIDEPTLAAIRSEYAALLDRLYVGWESEGLVAPAPDGASFWEKFDNVFRAGFDWYQPFDISLPHHDIQADTPMHIGPAVFDMATSSGLLDVVEQLIGPEITSNPIQHVRIKPPQKAVNASEARAHVIATDWHQDIGVTMPEADRTQFVTVWLAITDATVENGCLQVKPGKQAEMLPHCAQIQVGIAKGYLPDGDPVPTPVKAGGAVIFHPMTPHGSLSNNSDGYRWSFDLRYNVTGQPSGIWESSF